MNDMYNWQDDVGMNDEGYAKGYPTLPPHAWQRLEMAKKVIERGDTLNDVERRALQEDTEYRKAQRAKEMAPYVRDWLKRDGIRKLKFGAQTQWDGSLDVTAVPEGERLPHGYTQISKAQAEKSIPAVSSRWGYGTIDHTNSKSELMDWLIARARWSNLFQFKDARHKNEAKRSKKEMEDRAAAAGLVAPAAAPAPAPARDTVVMTQAQLDRMVPR